MNSRAIYREEGGKWLVEIVEDKSTETWEEYDIKILKQLRPARLEGNPAIGSIINIAGTKDVRYRHYVSWSLERIS